MKRFWCLGWLLLSVSAWSDPWPFRAALSFSSAQVHRDAETLTAHPAVMNFNLGYDPLPYAGVELEGSTGVADAQGNACTATCVSTNVSERAGFLALARLSWPQGRVRPYLRAGAGDWRLQSSVNGAVPTLTAWHVVAAGGGIAWQIDARSSLFIDALRLHASSADVRLFSLGFAQRFDFTGRY